MKAGLIPVGYNECLNRLLGNRGYVKYKGHLLPIIRKITMNFTLFDLKDLKGRPGDRVVVISDKHGDKNSIVYIYPNFAIPFRKRSCVI